MPRPSEAVCALVLTALIFLPTCKAADAWDDFTNNLATDLVRISRFVENVACLTRYRRH